MLEKIRKALEGYKTYFVAAGAIIGTVLAWVEGGVDAPEATKLIVAALLAMTLRAGIEKSK